MVGDKIFFILANGFMVRAWTPSAQTPSPRCASHSPPARCSPYEDRSAEEIGFEELFSSLTDHRPI